MIGKYDITLYNNKIHYHLTIKRNITVLRGDSASGKSELIRLLGAYNSSPSSSGITLLSERDCRVLNEENWRIFTGSYAGCIFFVDEGNSFLRKKEFADVIKGADNYFVIVTRESLSQLPYSIDEIYGLREDDATGKYRMPKRIYNEMYRIYGVVPKAMGEPDLIIAEDSNAGKEFFDLIFPGKCISANGKSNIKRLLAEHTNQKVLAIVDGAAFGSEMPGCMEMISAGNGLRSIYAPESFEFLILQSGVIEIPKSVIEETWDYADSVKYFSWEEFYSRYLAEATQNTVSQYSKSKLNEFYKTAGCVERIRKLLPEGIFD